MLSVPTATAEGDQPSAIRLRALSLGAGVQSTTLALMAAHGAVGPMPGCAIFADDLSEVQTLRLEAIDAFATACPITFPSYLTELAQRGLDLAGLTGTRLCLARPVATADRNFLPLRTDVRIPRGPRKPLAAVLHFIAAPPGCAPIVPGLFDSHRGRERRGPKHRKGIG